ncbi:hypothetical protein [Thiomonas bhubaneswarensis]|uniref:TraB family protein n=1 Tax=Thiomonas bhubaneswarensis TaxID=339866 RepID=A0A0K6I1A5_9BURK|nr:hypothetical protein [Thiomonas bhubaneswarensis]CUA96939.1 hypothetical protein Ga0061069_10531 [Thiomonas bhubaneswarensis]
MSTPGSSRWALATPGAVAAGGAWLLGGGSLLGPACSLVLPVLVACQSKWWRRLTVALAYYLTGCWPIVSAVLGYWGAQHAGFAIAGWLTASILLALPWALPSRRGGLLAALLLTALPPLGVIGWLSPMNAMGVLYPGSGWLGVVALVALVGTLPAAARGRRFGLSAVAGLLATGAFMNALAWSVIHPTAPEGWIGVRTFIRPGNGNVLADIQNNQTGIGAGLQQGAGARVVVFPEAILPDWYAGTQAQFAAAVPRAQVWLLGVQAGAHDAVVRVEHGRADSAPVAVAAGLLLGGDWQPWNPRTLHPAWWQQVFDLDGQRVWAALCVEQVQPWTWLEALWQRPTVILAQSNTWWATPGNAAPAIQEASTRAWARLMGVPVVTAVNR